MSSITPGLVSVTFRQLDAESIAKAAAENGLLAIEWGGDVHCPHGDVDAARRVANITRDAGLRTSAYGSYYRLGEGGRSPAFADVLASACALAAPVIRVWAGAVGSKAATDEDRERIARDLIAIADAAAVENVAVSLEYHGGTLTDSPSAAVELLRTAEGRPNVFSYWQPRHGMTIDENVAEIEALRPWLRDIHVFHWWPWPESRHPLADGAERWRAYLKAAGADGRERVAALEFIRGDRPEQLPMDAAALREALAAAAP